MVPPTRMSYFNSFPMTTDVPTGLTYSHFSAFVRVVLDNIIPYCLQCGKIAQNTGFLHKGHCGLLKNSGLIPKRQHNSEMAALYLSTDHTIFYLLLSVKVLLAVTDHYVWFTSSP